MRPGGGGSCGVLLLDREGITVCPKPRSTTDRDHVVIRRARGPIERGTRALSTGHESPLNGAREPSQRGTRALSTGQGVPLISRRQTPFPATPVRFMPCPPWYALTAAIVRDSNTPVIDSPAGSAALRARCSRRTAGPAAPYFWSTTSPCESSAIQVDWDIVVLDPRPRL